MCPYLLSLKVGSLRYGEAERAAAQRAGSGAMHPRRRSSHEPGSATWQRDPALAAVPQRYPRPSRSSKKNSFTSTASSSTTHTSADSTTFTSNMAAAPVPVSLFDGLLNHLETYVKAGTSAQFLKLTSDLVSDASLEALSKVVWSGSDPPGPATLGGLRCLLGKPEISAVADWANVIPTGGGQGFLNQEARWFEVHGFGLATKIAQTTLISTGAPGGAGERVFL
eukprot:COSAG06_NODE_18923_length_861_cov_2.140420_1_plen_224_part_00